MDRWWTHGPVVGLRVRPDWVYSEISRRRKMICSEQHFLSDMGFLLRCPWLENLEHSWTLMSQNFMTTCLICCWSTPMWIRLVPAHPQHPVSGSQLPPLGPLSVGPHHRWPGATTSLVVSEMLRPPPLTITIWSLSKWLRFLHLPSSPISNMLTTNQVFSHHPMSPRPRYASLLRANPRYCLHLWVLILFWLSGVYGLLDTKCLLLHWQVPSQTMWPGGFKFPPHPCVNCRGLSWAQRNFQHNEINNIQVKL